MARRTPVDGSALLLLLGGLSALILLLLGGWSVRWGEQARQARLAERAALLATAVQAVTAWYRVHLAELDSAGLEPPDPAAVLPPARAGLHVHGALGALRPAGEVFARRIALQVLPAESTGVADRTEVVDGAALEREAMTRARRQLQGLAARLEVWFRARVADDPLHRVDRNHFRPADPACLADAAELPCLADYTAVATVPGWSDKLALDAHALRTPWGPCCPIEASTGVDARTVAPFSTALRIRTPWGAVLRAQALGPGA